MNFTFVVPEVVTEQVDKLLLIARNVAFFVLSFISLETVTAMPVWPLALL